LSDTSIRYTFTATGHQAVVGAYTTIRNAAARTSALVTAHAAKTAGVQIAMMNRVRAASKAAETGKTTAAQTGAATRQTAAVRALQRERNVLRQLLAEYTKFEKMKTATAAAEGQKRVNRERRNQTRAAPKGRMGGVGRFAGRMGRTMGSFAAMGGIIAVAGGVGAAVRENVGIEDMARDIAVRGRDPGGERLSAKDIASNARRTAMAVPGARAKDVLAGTSAFLEQTGDLGKAQEASKVIAEIALATGSDMTDVANSAAALFMQFGTGSESMEEMREQLGLFVIQGKRGSFEMKDMSKALRRLAAAAKAAGVEGGVKQVATIGALAQFTARSAGGPEQAATALEGMFNLLMKKRGLIEERHGIDVKAIAQQDLASLLPKLFEATGGKQDVLAKMFPKRSITAILDLLNTFNKLKKEGNSNAEASAKLTQKIRDMADATGVAKDMAMDLAEQQQTVGNKLSAVWERVVQAFATGGGVDAVEGLVNELPGLLPLIPALVFAFKYAVVGISAFVEAIASFAEALGADMTEFRDAQKKMKGMQNAAERGMNIAKIESELGKDPTPERREQLEKQLDVERSLKADALRSMGDPEQLNRDREERAIAILGKTAPGLEGGVSQPGRLDQEVRDILAIGVGEGKANAAAGVEKRLRHTNESTDDIGSRIQDGGFSGKIGEQAATAASGMSDALASIVKGMVSKGAEIEAAGELPAALRAKAAEIMAIQLGNYAPPGSVNPYGI